MSGMPAYNYGPPPPPPPASNTGGYPHSNASYPHHTHGRGGEGSHGSRGRGGQYPRPRGDYHGPSQPHFDYNGQPYGSHLASYGSSHAVPASSYPPHPSQWSAEHGHAHHGTHSHAPAPLSASNYHPNYAPPYPHTAQHPQPPSYRPAQPYVQPYQSHSTPQVTHWTPQAPPAHSHFQAGRVRGGYGDRGGIKSKQNGGPARHSYDYEPSAAAAGAAPYSQSFLHDSRNSHHHSPPLQYTGPPPPFFPARHDSQNSQQSRRGRSGGPRDSARGRGGHHNSQHNHHGKNRHSHKPNHTEHKPNQTEHKPKPKIEAPSVGPSVGKKKKRKVNTLGLTPGVESESEDDEGEEKALTDLIGAETLQVSDVAAFLAERRKNYPTKARVEARKVAQVAQKSHDKTAELEKQAEKLRKQLARVESSIKRKREQGDEGDEMRAPAADTSGDEKPEVMSSRARAAPSQTPSAKKADVSRHCKYYSTGGVCGKRGKCRFVHDREVREAAIKEREANNGRMTIKQRLILNDQEQEDLTVLQSIQYLRKKGLMESSVNDEEGRGEHEEGADGQTKEEEDGEEPGSSQNKASPASADI